MPLIQNQVPVWGDGAFGTPVINTTGKRLILPSPPPARRPAATSTTYTPPLPPPVQKSPSQIYQAISQIGLVLVNLIVETSQDSSENSPLTRGCGRRAAGRSIQQRASAAKAMCKLTINLGRWRGRSGSFRQLEGRASGSG